GRRRIETAAAPAALRFRMARRRRSRTRTQVPVRAISFVRRRPITLTRANPAVPLHLDLDRAPRIIPLRVRRRIPEEVLVRQLVEQVLERTVELVDAVGRERAAAGGHGQTL